MLEILLYVIFFVSSILLVLVILLQEGKGGGLTDAFGSAGAETFGVRAGGINRFTFGMFGAFVMSAMLLHWTAKAPDSDSVAPPDPVGQEQPIVPPGVFDPNPPAGTGGGPGGTGGGQ